MEVNTVGFAELLVNGIARGMVLALLGAGITLVFGLGGVLNLAIGVFTIIAVIVGVELFGIVANPLVAAVGAVLVIGGVGLLVDRTLLSFVYRSEGEERTLLGIFVTLGLAIFLDGLLFIYYPSRFSFPLDLPALTIGPVFIQGSTVGVILVAVLVFAVLYAFLNRTYLGNAMRTVLQDEMGAILVGISPRRTYTLVFVLSMMIAAIAGLLFSLAASVQAADSLQFTIEAVIVSIVGGVTSIQGTIAAGVMLGVIITFANAFIGAYVAQLILLTIAIAALLIRPEQIT